jgi:hypothetical protein
MKLQLQKNVQSKLQASDNHTHLIRELKIHIRFIEIGDLDSYCNFKVLSNPGKA